MWRECGSFASKSWAGRLRRASLLFVLYTSDPQLVQPMDYIRLISSNHDFAKLWAAQLISLLGDWFSTIVISVLLITYTEGTGYQGIAVSGFLIARMLPPLLMRPLAGVLADRFDRKRLLIVSDLLRALVVLGLLLPRKVQTIFL